MPSGTGYSPQTPYGHYNREIKVPEYVIDAIRQMGMDEAIRVASSSDVSPEFIEGVRRFYPNAIPDIEAARSGLTASANRNPTSDAVIGRLGGTDDQGLPLGVGRGGSDSAGGPPASLPAGVSRGNVPASTTPAPMQNRAGMFRGNEGGGSELSGFFGPGATSQNTPSPAPAQAPQDPAGFENAEWNRSGPDAFMENLNIAREPAQDLLKTGGNPTQVIATLLRELFGGR